VDAEATVLRFYEAMNTGDGSLLDEVLAPGWENTPPGPGQGAGPDGFKPVLAWLRGVFPDLTITHEDIVVSADGSRVAVRSVTCGTHSAEMLGVPATGRQVEFRAFDFHHLADGRITRSWHLEDFAGLRSQLGRTGEST
jgi:steroid delta-isomerase-like uncharacterized protein